VLELEHATVDLERRDVHRRDGETVRLTTMEAKLLAWLVRRDDEVSRGELMREVWGYAEGTRSRTVDTTVARLRRKIEADPAHPTHLLSVVGVGYRFLGTTPSAPAASLPTLLGRATDLARLRTALASDDLVTVVGVGGLGKTRLADAFASGWPGAVRRLDLRAVDTLEGLVEYVHHILGSMSGGVEAAGRLLRRDTGALWLLDDAESLSDALAAVLPSWRSPFGARLLLTSRRPLGLDGERVVALPPLADEAAATLFQERLGRPLDEASRQMVTMLAGHPLSLELAAAQARTWSAARLVERASSWLDLLRDDGHQAPHHPDLRTILDDAWGSLTADARRAWVAVAVLGEGDVATLDAVLDAPVAAVVQLQRLAVLRVEAGRWRMSEVLRAYALEQVPDRSALLRRVVTHAECCVDDLDGPSCVRAMAQLVSLLPGLTRAVDELGAPWRERAWCTMGPPLVARRQVAAPVLAQDCPDELRARCLVVAARVHLVPWRPDDAAVDWLRAAADLAVTGGLAAEIRAQLGSLLARRGGFEEAVVHLETARELAGERELPGVLNLLGEVRLFAGDDSWPLHRRARALALEQGNVWQVAIAEGHLAGLEDERGRPEASDALHRSAIDLLAAVGDRRREVSLRLRRSGKMIHRGRLDDARGDLESLLATALADPKSRGHRWATGQLAYVALNADDTDEALDLSRRASGLARAAGDPSLETSAMLVETNTLLRLGALDDAAMLLDTLSGNRGRLGRASALRSDASRALLQALRGGTPALPTVPHTARTQVREARRLRALVALLSGDLPELHDCLDALLAETSAGHRQLRADAAVLRSVADGRPASREDLSWIGRVALTYGS
jgi:tetratricopeptide (TPR) repeat protein